MKILGFRSKKIWKKVLSVMYLSIWSLLFVIIMTEGKYYNLPAKDFIINKISNLIIFLFFLSPYIFLSQTKFREKLPLLKKHKLWADLVFFIILFIVTISLNSGILAFHTAEYIADMENHAYVEVSSTEATCEKDGMLERVCEFCGRQEKEIFSAKGHTFEIKEDTDEKTVKVCTLCNLENIENKREENSNGGEQETPGTEEEHRHKWEKANCEQPSICSDCGATKEEALGHTTDCGVCTRCNKEFRKKSPVTILNWTYTIDYVGGVEWNFRIKNNTEKQIKYVTMQWDCYNAVGDLIYDEIGGKSYVRVRFTGPLDAYATSSSKRNTNKFYNYNLKSYMMTEIIVEYMDGTSEKVTQYHDDIIG